MFFQLFGFRFAYPFDDVGGSIHHAHQRAVLVVYPDVDVVEHELLARAEVGGIARRLCHHQLAVAMCGVEQFGSAAADVFFHFDAGFEQIVVVEFQLGVISVEVESVQYNRILFPFHDFGRYQAQGRIRHIGIEKRGSDLAIAGKGIDVERAYFLHHHFGLRSVFVPLFGLGDYQPQGKSQRIADADILVHAFYLDIGGGFARLDGYGIGNNFNPLKNIYLIN